MKKSATVIVLLAGAAAGYSQGTINWSDYIAAFNSPPGFSITVFSPGPGGVEQNMGNTANGSDVPPGTAVYFGVPIGGGQGGTTGPTGYGNGADYTIGLYAGTSADAVQAAVQSGVPIATDTFLAGGGGWDFSGSLPATLPTQSGFASGDPVYFQLAAWYNGSGATSYSEAVANGVANDPAGFSSVSDPIIVGGEANLADSGITDFSLASVPEPGTISLGLIGASGFLLRLRRRR